MANIPQIYLWIHDKYTSTKQKIIYENDVLFNKFFF